MNYNILSIWYIVYILFWMTFSILNLCWFVFGRYFSWNVRLISSPLRSLITYLHGTVFLASLITKTSSDQFGVYPSAKKFLYYDIITYLQALNLGSLSLLSLIESIYVLSLTSTGFILIVLWYILLYSFTISSNLSIYTFFDTDVL